jgi:hypothetical protein
MKTAALLFLILACVGASAQERKPSYDSFKLVRTRNIFDPNRRAMRTESREPRSEGRSRPNWISLTGVMVSNEKSLAFFNSSRSDGRKVAGIGETVADFKIVAITPLQVEWEHAGKRSVLAVGRQIELSGTTVEPVDTAPALPGEDSNASHPADGSATPPASSTAPPAGVPGDKNDVLRRMMERRQKELSK